MKKVKRIKNENKMCSNKIIKGFQAPLISKLSSKNDIFVFKINVPGIKLLMAEM